MSEFVDREDFSSESQKLKETLTTDLGSSTPTISPVPIGNRGIKIYKGGRAMLSIKRVDWGPLEQMNSRLLREPVSGLIILCTNGELANLMKVYAGAPGSERNEQPLAGNILNRVRVLLDSLAKEQDWLNFPLGSFDMTLLKELTNNPPRLQLGQISKLDLLLIDTLTKLARHEDQHYTELREKLNLQFSQRNIDVDQSDAIRYCQPQLQRIKGFRASDKFNIQNNFLIRGQAILQGEEGDVEYKNYRYPIQEIPLVFTLKKTICGFMNGSGGIIVLGVLENQKQQKWWVEGIRLNLKKDKNDQNDFDRLKKFFTKLLLEVYPKYSGVSQKHNDDRELKQQEELEKDWLKNMIVMDCIRVRSNLLNEADEFDLEGRTLNLVIVKIKAGEPDQLYHIYEREDETPKLRNPMYFVRNHHETIQLKSLMKVQDEIYRRQNREESNYR